MVCLACQAVVAGKLCSSCRRTMTSPAERLLPGGLRLVAAFEHIGAAQVLVHHLKYRGLTVFAEMVADAVADRLPRLPLVPVPRALSRRIKYGIDPARALAAAMGRRLGTPVVDLLAPPLHAPRRAGRDHSRPVRPFRARSRLRSEVIVVDDVVTTGMTVVAAVNAIGMSMVRAAVAANVVTDVSNVSASATGPKPGGTEFGNRFDR